tara:strand:- start:141595 stop:143364 length:1770 start_codon:yes stop_codon:yes gene_type:complete
MRTQELAVVLSTIILLGPCVSNAQDEAATKDVQARADNDSRMTWWREAKFGMFVHWGVYSVVGGKYKGQDLPNSAEWMMARGKIPITEYEKYAAQFNPTKFDANEFVGRAKRAGMKYLVITAKHHDGFAMFGSKCSDYNVVDKTPFGRDIMKEIADACQKQDIKFGFYYSQAQDWHHPGGFGNSWDKTIKRVSNDQYVMDKAVPEVTQLLTEYGPIGIFWWDTPRKMSRKSFDSLHSLTRMQPHVITNDRLGEGCAGDYKTFERHIPRQVPVGKDWEVCMPISGSWGYKIGDNDFKSTTKLIRNLIEIASMGGNYLLNVSPTGEGTLLPAAVERLESIGAWMDINGESIYGTQRSPIENLQWGRCTRKQHDGKTLLYLHVFHWPQDGQLLVPGLQNNIEHASLLDGGVPLQCNRTSDGVTITLPAKAPDPHASVVVLKVKGTLDVAPNLPTVDARGKVVLTADKAYINNNEGGANAGLRMHNNIPHIGYWLDRNASVEWTFRTRQPGEYEVRAVISVQKPKSRFSIKLAGQPLMVEADSTGGYGNYVEKNLGMIRIDQAGEHTLRVKPDAAEWNPINLRQVELRFKKPN